MPVKYFITDFDGVIVDTMPALTSAFVKILRPLGISESAALSQLRRSMGSPLETQIKDILAADGKSASDSEIERMKTDFSDACEGQPIRIFPAVKETLETIKRQGIFILRDLHFVQQRVRDRQNEAAF